MCTAGQLTAYLVAMCATALSVAATLETATLALVLAASSRGRDGAASLNLRAATPATCRALIFALIPGGSRARIVLAKSPVAILVRRRAFAAAVAVAVCSTRRVRSARRAPAAVQVVVALPMGAPPTAATAREKPSSRAVVQGSAPARARALAAAHEGRGWAGGNSDPVPPLAVAVWSTHHTGKELSRCQALTHDG